MRKAALLVLGLMVAVGLCSCVSSDELKNLQLRVAQQEEQIKYLKGNLADSQPAQAEMWSGVQSMRSDVAALQGSVQNLQRQMDMIMQYPPMLMAEDVARMKGWWRQIDSQMALNLDWNAKPVITPVAPGELPGYGATPPVQDGAVPPAPPIDGQADQPVPPAQSGAAATTDQALYNAGLEAFRARQYDRALSIWEEFVKVYPNNSLVPQAWFWQGESLYQEGKFDEAILRYQEVVEKYATSPKYPAALLKQGVSFMKIGKDRAGRILLEDLIKRFPNAPEAQQARSYLSRPVGKN